MEKAKAGVTPSFTNVFDTPSMSHRGRSTAGYAATQSNVGLASDLLRNALDWNAALAAASGVCRPLSPPAPPPTMPPRPVYPAQQHAGDGHGGGRGFHVVP